MEPDDKTGSPTLKKACVACGQEFHGDVTLCPDDGTLLTPLAQQPIIGAVIGDRYKIIEVIGDGGMGMVFKATHLLMKRTVAIKMLHPHLVSSAAALKRFQKEAEALSALNHPNILTVFDFGLTTQGNPFLVMDFLEGDTLAGLLEEGAALDTERAIGIFVQTCSGLAHAHQKGVIHRDLKPANLMLIDYDDQKDFVKILDFGIAKVVSGETTGLTQTGDVFGSPLYMSPEQCRGQELDLRTDIYSLGCVMYRTLAGSCTVSGSDALECMFKQVSELPPRFADLCPERNIPEGLEAVVFKALAKDPNDRFATMGALRAALEESREPNAPRYVTREFTPTASQPFPAQAVPDTMPPISGMLDKTLKVGDLADGPTVPVPELSDKSAAGSEPGSALPASGTARVNPRLLAVGAALVILVVVAAVLVFQGQKRPPGTGTTTAPTASDGTAFGNAMAAGKDAYNQGDYNKAAGSYQSAVDSAQNSGNQTQLATALDALGSVQYDLGKYTVAGDELKQSYNLREKEFGLDSLEVAESLTDLGKVYIALEQFPAAETALKRALKSCEAKAGADSLPYADAAGALGYYYLTRGDYEKSLEYLRKSLVIRQTRLGRTDPLVAQICNNLGQVYELKGDLTNAEKLYKTALAIRSLKLSDNDPALAESLSTLGTLLLNKKNYGDAEKLIKQALDIQLKAFGPDSIVVAKNQYNLGVLYYNQARFAEALPMLKSAFETAQSITNMTKPTAAQIKKILDDCTKRSKAPATTKTGGQPPARPRPVRRQSRPRPAAKQSPQNFHW